MAYIRGYDWFLKIRKPKIDLWHVPRYEKFSYQGYHLFILKKVIREIVEFCRYNSESQTVIQKITRIKSRSP